jgi:predicted transcriptional regulator
VTFSFDPSIFAFVFSSLAKAQKLVRTLHDRLKIIEEIEKNPGEKRVDIAKRLGLPASTLNTIFAKKNDIREQIQKCGNACKK